MNLSQSGIYQIFNTLNHKRYIGSTNNFKRRKSEHFYELTANRHYNKYLQRAVNKYGISVFEFVVLEYCSEQDLVERELYWINFAKPEYNAVWDSNREFIGYKHSAEIKKKMKKLMRQRWNNFTEEERILERKRLSDIRKNAKTPCKEATKQKIGKKTKERWSRWSSETKQQIRIKIAKTKSKPVLQYDKYGTFIAEYPSMVEAAIAIGKTKKDNTRISNCCKNKRKSAYGYIWKYKII